MYVGSEWYAMLWNVIFNVMYLEAQGSFNQTVAVLRTQF